MPSNPPPMIPADVESIAKLVTLQANQLTLALYGATGAGLEPRAFAELLERVAWHLTETAKLWRKPNVEELAADALETLERYSEQIHGMPSLAIVPTPEKDGAP